MDLSAHEWASWALLGEPHVAVPDPLKELHGRVQQAVINYAMQSGEKPQARKEEAKL